MAGEHPRGSYDRPRIVIAGALTGILIALLFIDSTSAEYALGEVTLTVIVGTILTLLGLELTDVIKGGRG